MQAKYRYLRIWKNILYADTSMAPKENPTLQLKRVQKYNALCSTRWFLIFNSYSSEHVTLTSGETQFAKRLVRRQLLWQCLLFPRQHPLLDNKDALIQYLCHVIASLSPSTFLLKNKSVAPCSFLQFRINSFPQIQYGR